MLKQLVLLTIAQIVQSVCPTEKPSCLYQVPDTALGALNLWSTTSCTSVATWLFLVYEQVNTTNIITKIVVGTSDSANYALETANYQSNTTQTNISLSTDSVSSINASYITNDYNLTQIRQLVVSLTGGSVVEWPPNNETDFNGTTNSSLVLTGQLVGFEIDTDTSLFYIKQRYFPTIDPSPIPQLNYLIGQPSLMQSLSFAWPATPVPAATSIYFQQNKPSLLEITFESPLLNLTLPFLDDNTTTAVQYANRYRRYISAYFDDVCGVIMDFNFTINQTLCTDDSNIISLPPLIQTYFEHFIFYPAIRYDFSPATDTQYPLCGGFYYWTWTNPWNATGAFFQNQISPQITFQSNVLSLADGVDKQFRIYAGFQKRNYQNISLSNQLSVRWKDPCGLANNTVFVTSPMQDMTTSVLVPIQSSNYSTWRCYIDTLYAGGCGAFSYSLKISSQTIPSPINVSLITLNQQNKTVFNVSVASTTNADIGVYDVEILGSLLNYPTVVTSAFFKVNIGGCIVTSIIVSLQNASQDYYVGTAQQFNSITVSQSPACGYQLTLSITSSAPSQLLSLDNTNSKLIIGVYQNLTLLSTTSVISIPVTATINDPRNSGISSASSYFTLKLLDPCLNTSISASPISIIMQTFDPIGSLPFAEFTDTVSVNQGGTTPICGDRVYELLNSTHPYSLSLSNQTIRTFQYSSFNVVDEGIYMRTLKVYLKNYPSIVHTQLVSVVVKNPCRYATLVMPSISDLTITVLQNQVNRSFGQFDDSVSMAYGQQVCGQRKYWLSWTTVNNWNGVLNSQNAFFPNQNTPLISAGATSQDLTGNYTISVYCSLVSYTNISSGPTTFNLQILPCRVDSFTMLTPDKSQYVLNYLQSLGQAQTFTYTPVQALACNYTAKVTVITPLPNNSSNFITYFDLGQSVTFSVLSTLRAQIGTYTIHLTYELTNYPTQYYSYWLKTQSFSLSILDPCPLTLINPLMLPDLQVMSSYSASIQDELSLTPFQNDQAYQNKLPMHGVYFYDSVSQAVQQFDFCGSKKFSFSGTYPNCLTFLGKNGDILTLKAAANCKAGVYNVTLNVSMAENSSNSIVSNFKSVVILVSPTWIGNRLYILNTQNTSFTFWSFQSSNRHQGDLNNRQRHLLSLFYIISNRPLSSTFLPRSVLQWNSKTTS